MTDKNKNKKIPSDSKRSKSTFERMMEKVRKNQEKTLKTLFGSRNTLADALNATKRFEEHIKIIWYSLSR